MTAFLAIAVVMTLLAVALVVVPLFRETSAPAPVAGLLTALAIPASVTLLYAAISSYPWASVGPGAASPATNVAALPTEVTELRAQVDSDPQDAAGWIRLGDAYVGQELFAEARDAYRQAITLGGEGAADELRLAFAEAAILADRNALAGEAGQLIDEVLSKDPVNPKALWYGGMAALARGDATGARDRWSRLLELSPPPQVRHIIEQQLAGIGQGAAGPAGPPLAEQTRIPVRVSIKPELSGRIRPGAALFLIARAPGGAGPPLAVVRRDSAVLPLEIEISDADSMVPGRSLSGLAEVKLTARIANDGEALPAAGDVFGEAVWNPRSGGSGPLLILMDQVVR